MADKPKKSLIQLNFTRAKIRLHSSGLFNIVNVPQEDILSIESRFPEEALIASG
jgi:hypothetical protein